MGPDVEPEEVKQATQLRRSWIFLAVPRCIQWVLRRKTPEPRGRIPDDEKGHESSSEPSGKGERMLPNGSFCDAAPPTRISEDTNHVSICHYTTPVLGRSPFCSATPTVVGFPLSRVASPAPTVIAVAEPSLPSPSLLPTTCEKLSSDSPPINPEIRYPKLVRVFNALLYAILTPPSFSIILSLIIAFIHPLKSLFVPVRSSTSVHIHSAAPDGGPPLAVIFDTAGFIGAASVPLGLISLGAALARLTIQRNQWRSLPLGAISALAIAKMIVMPLLGVGIVKGFVKVGLVSREDRVLQFVCLWVPSFVVGPLF